MNDLYPNNESSIPVQNIRTINEVVDLSANIETAYRCDDIFIIVGWVYSREYRVIDFSLLSNASRSNAYKGLKLADNSENSKLITFDREDVIKHFNHIDNKPPSIFGFVITTYKFNIFDKLAIELENNSFVTLPLNFIENLDQISASLQNMLPHSGTQLLEWLTHKVGDESGIVKYIESLMFHAQLSLPDRHKDQQRQTYNERFNIEYCLRTKSGLILIGWYASLRTDNIPLNITDDKGTEKNLIFSSQESNITLLRTFRPDLKPFLTPEEFVLGNHGFVLYFAEINSLIGTLTIKIGDNTLPQTISIVTAETNAGINGLINIWTHAGEALKKLALINYDKEMSAFFNDVEHIKIGKSSHAFSGVNHAYILNSHTMMLIGWIAKHTIDIRKVEVITESTTTEISKELFRFPRPDLLKQHPWSTSEPLGFVYLNTDFIPHSGEVRLRITCNDTDIQVIQTECQAIDWAFLAQLTNDFPDLFSPLISALKSRINNFNIIEEHADVRIDMLYREAFNSKHAHLPPIIEQSEILIAGIDYAIPIGDKGLIISGWDITPGKTPLRVTVRSPEDQSDDIRSNLIPTNRKDITTAYMSKYPSISTFSGYLCHIPLPTHTGEPRSLCYEFENFGEISLKIPTESNELSGEQLTETLLKTYHSLFHKDALFDLCKELSIDAYFNIAIEEAESKAYFNNGITPLVVCDDALAIFGKLIILQGWFSVEEDEIDKLEIILSNSLELVSDGIIRIYRHDLIEKFPRSADKASGYILVHELPHLPASGFKLRVTALDGISQLISIKPRDINIIQLSEYLNKNSNIPPKLFNLLHTKLQNNAEYSDVEQNIEWLYSNYFLSQHRQLSNSINIPGVVHCAIDHTYTLNDIGILIIGWILTPSHKPYNLTVGSPTGQSDDISNKVFPLRRDDVSNAYRDNYPGVNNNCGFICLANVPTSYNEPRTLNFNFIDHGCFSLKLPTNKSKKSGIELSKEVLSHLPQPGELFHKLYELFDIGLGDALQSISSDKNVSRRSIIQKQFGSPPENPQFSVIIPLYGRCDFIRHQLAQFTDDIDFQFSDLIYIVDDPRLTAQAIDISAKYHKLFNVPFRVIHYGENLGFAAANNIGVNHARADNIILLNSDVIPQSTGWTTQLITALNSLPDAGAVGPLLLFGDDSIQHAGMYPKRDQLLTNFLLNTHINMGMRWSGDDSPSEHPMLTAACLALHKQDYISVGGLDEGYLVGDFEDSDLCLALRKSGKKLWLVPKVRLWHLERQSQNTKEIAAQRQLITLYNGWRYSKKISMGTIADPENIESVSR